MKKYKTIIKASGEREIFSESKFRYSLKKAGVLPRTINEIVEEVVPGIKDGTSTSQIYARAFSILRKKQKPAAEIYGLRKAVMQLGPSGHPFERLVAGVLEYQGFSVKVNQLVRGRCVSHEVDVVARKNNHRIMVECKFHNQQGIKSDVKTALYVQARFEDVDRQWQSEPDHQQRFNQAWLVTNTKLTADAIKYAKCVGLNVIAWDYPRGRGLQDLIEEAGLYPLTCLASLSASQKRQLLARGLVLCRDILQNRQVLRILGLNQYKSSQMTKEIEGLMGENHEYR